MGPRCSWLFLFLLICVTDSIKGFSRRRGYWSILLSICRVTYILRIYVRLVNYVEIPIVLLYLLRCLVYHMLSKTRRNSRSLHRVIAYICCIYFVRCLVYHMLFKTRRNSGSLHRVIGEVVVLGLLVVVYKIPYSSCIFNTAVVLEPGTMMCACLSGTGTL